MLNQSVQSCRVAFLKKWSPESHFFGLIASEQGLTLNPSLFSCCGGDGVMVDPQNPRDAKLCGLKRRWNLLFKIVDAWTTMRVQRNETGRDEHFKPLWSQNSAATSRRTKALDGLFKGHLDNLLRSSKGSVLKISDEGATASAEDRLPWLAAATMAWHFETLVLVARIGVSPLPLLQWGEMLEKHPNVRSIVFVEGVSELWSPNRLESLEAIISFASERLLPIWLFEEGSPPSGSQSNPSTSPQDSAGNRPRPSSFKAVMNKRMTNIRSKPAIDWLSEQGRSRLSEICDVPPLIVQGSAIPNLV
jgi:hypothetical protein